MQHPIYPSILTLKESNIIIRTLLITISVAIGFIDLARAADDLVKKAIKARRGVMQVRSFNAGSLFAMAKGDIEYDRQQDLQR